MDPGVLEVRRGGVPGHADLRAAEPGFHHQLGRRGGEAAPSGPGADLAVLRSEHRHPGAVLRPHQRGPHQPGGDGRHGGHPQAQPGQGRLLPDGAVPGRRGRSRHPLRGHPGLGQGWLGRHHGEPQHHRRPRPRRGALHHLRTRLHRLRHLRPQTRRPQRLLRPRHRPLRVHRTPVCHSLHWCQHEPGPLLRSCHGHLELGEPLGVLGGSSPGRDPGSRPVRLPVLPRPGAETALRRDALQDLLPLRQVPGGPGLPRPREDLHGPGRGAGRAEGERGAGETEGVVGGGAVLRMTSAVHWERRPDRRPVSSPQRDRPLVERLVGSRPQTDMQGATDCRLHSDIAPSNPSVVEPSRFGPL